jgi:hypothetical protein
MRFLEDFVKESSRLGEAEFLSVLEMLFEPSKNTSNKTIVPHLIKAYGLEELAHLIPQFDFAKALEWQKLRGSPESVVIALEMAGAKVKKITEMEGQRWNSYKVLLEKTTTSEQMIALCKLSAPLRAKLLRISDAAKEVSSLKLSSKSGKIGRNILSNFSGVKIGETWVDL